MSQIVQSPESAAPDLRRRQAERARQVQVVMAWCGPVFTLCLFGGWGLMAGFIPLVPATDSAAQVAEHYASNQTLRLIGLTLAMGGAFLTLPFSLVVSLQMRRAEPGVPMMSALQFGSGIVVTVISIVPMVFFMVGAFRPERPAEITLLMNDFSYILLILPWPPVVGQLVAIAVVTLGDGTDEPVFPRWIAWFSLWLSFLVLPASLIVFFHDGVFAWTGMIGFWIPAAAFGSWFPVMTWALLRAIRQEALAAGWEPGRA
ncbi:hypothetical protein [Nocardioides sp. WS12]|uniref:hypothetical protein n=1 Tax=Nocardioides sp. WS12 TaxID=2486272 RepID=UPI0015FE578B|nr:hypothetical protein [Nocardioides sp. WS12]